MIFSKHKYYLFATGALLFCTGTAIQANNLSLDTIQAAQTTAYKEKITKKISLNVFLDGHPSQQTVVLSNFKPSKQPQQLTLTLPKKAGYSSYVNYQPTEKLTVTIQADGTVKQDDQVEYRSTITDSNAVTLDAHITVTKNGQPFEITIPNITAIPGGKSVTVAAPEVESQPSHNNTGLELKLTSTGKWEVVNDKTSSSQQPVTEDVKLEVLVDGKVQEITIPQVTAIPNGPAITIPAAKLNGYTSELATWKLHLTKDGHWITEQPLRYQKEKAKTDTRNESKQENKNQQTTEKSHVEKTVSQKKMPQVEDIGAPNKNNRQKSTQPLVRQNQVQPKTSPTNLLTPTVKASQLPAKKQQAQAPTKKPNHSSQKSKNNNLVMTAGTLAALLAILSLGFYKLR